MTSLPLYRTATAVALASLLFGCEPPAGTDGGVDAAVSGRRDASFVPDGSILCERDEECDDGVDCTDDSCGPTGICRNLINVAFCQNGIFCDGIEQCDPRDGCVPGPRETCNAMDVCTIDRCNEDAEGGPRCEYFPRDLDMDGDVDFFCAGGGDCDDTDPTISSLLNEVCADGADNDCDGMIDESDCGRPLYDTCEDWEEDGNPVLRLDVSGGGYFMLDPSGSARDYTHGCGPTPPTRDLVAGFTLTERRSVFIEAIPDFFSATLSLRTECTERTSDLACRYGFPATIRQRALDPGTYYILIGGSGPIGLRVTFDDPIDPPANNTCATPTDVSAGGSFPGAFVEVTDTQSLSCSVAGSGDLFYTFTTSEEQDVRISATDDAGGYMAYSLRSTCADPDTELRCERGVPASGTVHRLPMGEYFIAVEDPSGSNANFTLDVSFLPPTDAAPGDSCNDPITIETDGVPVAGTLLGLENDHAVGCGLHFREAVYHFHLDAAADVSIDFNAGGLGNFSVRTTCDDAGTELRCPAGEPTFQRLRNLAAGDYYVLVEANNATSYTLTVSEAPPTTPIPVSNNDRCDMGTVPVITAPGGLYSGSTLTPMSNDYSTAGCGSATANDAAFRLDLAADSRVVISTEDSAYDTILHVHSGSCVSGAEAYCNDDQGPGLTHSFLDVNLAAGTHYIIVDGFSTGGVGDYVLEVLVDP